MQEVKTIIIDKVKDIIESKEDLSLSDLQTASFIVTSLSNSMEETMREMLQVVKEVKQEGGKDE
jgi:hypothetical protein